MPSNITTVSDLVNALGGSAHLARRFNLGQSAVCNWVTSGDIPRGWHLVLYLLAQRSGYSVDLDVFGLGDDEIDAFLRAA